MNGIFVGVNVGGTRTTAVVGNATEILGRAHGPGAAVRPGRALTSANTIADVSRKALASAGELTAEAMVVGAAGAGRDPERNEVLAALLNEQVAERVQVTTDIEIALVAAFPESPGIVLNAGTGSIALGRDAEGKTHRTGGFGWQMGDEGSGYGIGKAAMGAVSRAHDGRGPSTKLTLRAMAAAKANNFDQFVSWGTTATPADVAALAPGVIEMAQLGDQVAQGIVDYAVRELVLLVTALQPRCGGSPNSVALAGGLLATDGLLRPAIIAKLKETRGIAVVEADVDGAIGALGMARKLK
ncbi:MAG: BadF/BadG/BcrA/BcrD ATPase family protein [Gemmatimonadota bacterium]